MKNIRICIISVFITKPIVVMSTNLFKNKRDNNDKTCKILTKKIKHIDVPEGTKVSKYVGHDFILHSIMIVPKVSQNTL